MFANVNYIFLHRTTKVIDSVDAGEFLCLADAIKKRRTKYLTKRSLWNIDSAAVCAMIIGKGDQLKKKWKGYLQSSPHNKNDEKYWKYWKNTEQLWNYWIILKNIKKILENTKNTGKY